ncbi:unnamed protein product [Parnassius mnemosyne]|uniref:Protein lin-37 homolog n=1 Tax=Parnassius mnemosyne TaxID=213953 RepID=A0AAV1KFS0_9NEOP
MSKRVRLLTTKNKSKINSGKEFDDFKDKEVFTARGRLKGALMEVLGDESDASSGPSPVKRERQTSQELERDYTSEEEDKPDKNLLSARQSYVLKLFDRSVDLSQFSEDSPLYPICRAWIKNQPKANYSAYGRKYTEPKSTELSVELPGPEGSPVSRIPELIPEQKAHNKDNINLNYREAPPPSKEQLLQEHCTRWAAVRMAWLDQAAKVEARYDQTQRVLNSINVNTM